MSNKKSWTYDEITETLEYQIQGFLKDPTAQDNEERLRGNRKIAFDMYLAWRALMHKFDGDPQVASDSERLKEIVSVLWKKD